MRTMLSIVFLLLLASLSSAVPQSDLITNLPGLEEKTSFRAFSGYLDATLGRHMFYMFVESQNDPDKDPVVLWLSGGPGCSSLAGILHEHGPFRLQPGGEKIKLNPYSWNKVANVLYLESPPGTGFSYSENGEYETGDIETAGNNTEAIKNFFKKFPEFVKNDFYITGESKAGVYVPTLAKILVTDRTLSRVINLKGIAIGNGELSRNLKEESQWYYLYYHGFIEEDLFQNLIKHCCSGKGNCDMIRPNEQCLNYVEYAWKGMKWNGNKYWPVYNILNPKYIEDEEQYEGKNLFSTRVKRNGGNEKTTRNMDAMDTARMAYTEKYVNSAAVREALHVWPNKEKWVFCGLKAFYKGELPEMEEFIKTLLKHKIRILVYYGDLDIVCPFLMGQWFVNRLGAPLVNAKRPWFVKDKTGNKRLAGFVKDFENISFMTVMGAGHMVTADKPYEGLELFKRFLKGGAY